MPKLSPTMTEGFIAKWHKAPGDFVEAGDLVLEISTDKATVEHNALDAGWLRKILVQDGEKAEVNAVLAIMTETKDEPFSDTLPSTGQEQTPKKEQKKADEVHKPIAKSEESNSANDRPIASPLAKKLAASKGIPLQGIKGSGPRGRIMSRDLPESACCSEKTHQAPMKEIGVPTPKPASSGEIRVEPLSQMRQVIAKRLQESKATIPHFYATVDVNAGKLVALREELKAAGHAITVNDIIVKAVSLALMEHPVVRTTFDPVKNTVQYHPHADISIAVSINGGLITPIVQRADEKPLSAISSEIKELAEKAKANKLAPHEFIGGNFTISNLGMFGTSEFQAIINPPQTAILAVGAAIDMPIVQGTACVPGKVMKLTLSCDHRVVDGADAAKFLKTLKEKLESPISVIIG